MRVTGTQGDIPTPDNLYSRVSLSGFILFLRLTSKTSDLPPSNSSCFISNDHISGAWPVIRHLTVPIVPMSSRSSSLATLSDPLLMHLEHCSEQSLVAAFSCVLEETL